MRPRTARKLLKAWRILVGILLGGGTGVGAWIWWDSRQRALFPPPLERKPDTHGRIVAVAKVDGYTQLTILHTSGGSEWLAWVGPETQMRTRDRLRSKLEVEQLVKVWYCAEQTPGDQRAFASYILVEGYRPK